MLPMPRERADAVHDAVDQAGVHAAPEHHARAFDHRLHDSGVVDFVDEIFVVDQRVQAADGLGERIGKLGTRDIK